MSQGCKPVQDNAVGAVGAVVGHNQRNDGISQNSRARWKTSRKNQDGIVDAKEVQRKSRIQGNPVLARLLFCQATCDTTLNSSTESASVHLERKDPTMKLKRLSKLERTTSQAGKVAISAISHESYSSGAVVPVTAPRGP